MPELAPAGGGQVQLVEVVGEVAPRVDRAAVVRRPPDLVWRPQHELLGLSAAAAALRHGHEDGVRVLPAVPPLVRCYGRDVRLGLWVQVLLKREVK